MGHIYQKKIVSANAFIYGPCHAIDAIKNIKHTMDEFEQFLCDNQGYAIPGMKSETYKSHVQSALKNTLKLLHDEMKNVKDENVRPILQELQELQKLQGLSQNMHLSTIHAISQFYYFDKAQSYIYQPSEFLLDQDDAKKKIECYDTLQKLHDERKKLNAETRNVNNSLREKIQNKKNLIDQKQQTIDATPDGKTKKLLIKDIKRHREDLKQMRSNACEINRINELRSSRNNIQSKIKAILTNMELPYINIITASYSGVANENANEKTNNIDVLNGITRSWYSFDDGSDKLWLKTHFNDAKLIFYINEQFEQRLNISQAQNDDVLDKIIGYFKHVYGVTYIDRIKNCYDSNLMTYFSSDHVDNLIAVLNELHSLKVAANERRINTECINLLIQTCDKLAPNAEKIKFTTSTPVSISKNPQQSGGNKLQDRTTHDLSNILQSISSNGHSPELDKTINILETALYCILRVRIKCKEINLYTITDIVPASLATKCFLYLFTKHAQQVAIDFLSDVFYINIISMNLQTKNDNEKISSNYIGFI